LGLKKEPTFLAWMSLVSVALFGIHRALSKDSSIALVLLCVGGSITFLSLIEALLRRRSFGAAGGCGIAVYRNLRGLVCSDHLKVENFRSGH
jgi:hypothetical protein